MMMADLATDTQPHAGASGNWTPAEDAKLRRAVTNTRKKKRGKDYKIDWLTIASLVQGRTKMQRSSRRYYSLDPNLPQATRRTSKRTADEGKKLENAVEAHGTKNWKNCRNGSGSNTKAV